MKLVGLAAAVFVTAWGAPAATLVGTQVGGGLYFPGFPQNYFDPANNRVPAGYLNVAGPTVTISASAVEFGFDDGTARITADFTDTQLVVTDVPSHTSFYFPLQLVFTNIAFTNLSSGSDNFPSGGLSSSLAGNVITLDWGGGDVTAGIPLQAVFAINAPPSPQLSIQLTPTNTVAVSWPAPSTGFNLEQNASAASTNWIAVPTAPTVVDGRKEVIIAAPAGTRFYRLKYP